MTRKHTITATILDAGGGGAFVEVPFNVEKTFGSKKPKVKAMIDGVQYRVTLVRMESENHLLIILKSIREQIGKTFGDEIKVSVKLDTEERVVTVPAELNRAFRKDLEAKTFFEKLSYTHQKQYVTWIEDSKNEETRQRRISKMIDMLKTGKRGV